MEEQSKEKQTPAPYAAGTGSVLKWHRTARRLRGWATGASGAEAREPGAVRGDAEVSAEKRAGNARPCTVGE